MKVESDMDKMKTENKSKVETLLQSLETMLADTVSNYSKMILIILNYHYEEVPKV